MRKIAVLAMGLATLSAVPAFAQDAADDAALMLADSATAPVEQARDWHASVEAAFGQTRARNDGALNNNARLSWDFSWDQRLGNTWRAVAADQLDTRWQNAGPEHINTLKEAYLSWQPQADQALDVGRINARYGVALGYNPTDFFRAGANRSIVSLDPASLKKNRLGSVMLRGQHLWEGGSLTALVSPKLADEPSDAPFSADLGASNGQNRWLLALSQQVGDLQPQVILFGQAQHAPQLGLNLTGLVNEATVAYVEWSGGRSKSQLSEVLGVDDSAFRSRLASGFTYTTTNKLSLTAELQFNGAALERDAWEALPQQSIVAYGRYRAALQSSQGLPTRRAVFLYASWQDAMLNHLDINAMLRLNADDHSNLSWLEARYHWGRSDLALQWQVYGGSSASEYGAAKSRQAVQVALRYFF